MSLNRINSEGILALSVDGVDNPAELARVRVRGGDGQDLGQGKRVLQDVDGVLLSGRKEKIGHYLRP